MRLSHPPSRLCPRFRCTCRLRPFWLSDGDPKSGLACATQQLRDRRERTHKRQILGLETGRPPLFQFFAMVTLVISGLEDGDKLIASLTYLASRLRKAHVVTKLEHRFVPRDRMEIHRVQ